MVSHKLVRRRAIGGWIFSLYTYGFVEGLVWFFFCLRAIYSYFSMRLLAESSR